jgi:KDO2-lipid IV(A) lauroyltransferase
MLSALKDRLTTAAYAAAWWLVCRAPESWGRWAFRQAGEIAWRRQGPGVQLLEANLRRVVGPEPSGKELRALSRAGMHSYARYWFEVFRLPVISAGRLLAGMRCEGEDRLFAALAGGRGVVLALPHMGNWDQAGAWVIARGVPMFTTVAERLKPEAVFDRFVEYRQSIGMEVIALTGGDRSATSVLAERLRANRAVCLLADRDLSRSGIEVDFFGERAKMPAGPALLAATTGASLHVVHSYFPDDTSWGHDISAPIDLPEDGALREKVTVGTQRMADLFAEGIAKRPVDWHMLQRLWLADLTPRPEQ